MGIVLVGCSTESSTASNPDGGTSPNGAETRPTPWAAGCGDVVSCSFLFGNLPQYEECLRKECAAEIEACGSDGAACARGLRCADDAIAADYASGCFKGSDVSAWQCYFGPFSCVQDLLGQPPARAFAKCAVKCVPTEPMLCGGIPRTCSAAPRDSECATCLKRSCSSGCVDDECAAAVPCIERCRRGSCDTKKRNACELECTKRDLPRGDVQNVYSCIESLCQAECCQ